MLIGLCVAALSIALDQLSKHWLIGLLDGSGFASIQVTGFFNLVMVWNHGVSFGMLSEPGTNVRYFLMAVAFVIVGVMGFWLHSCTSRLVSVAIGLVIGGAIGNVIDRIRFGAVADFLDFHLFEYHWPAFNVADASIFCGVALLLWDGILHRPPTKSKSLNS